MQTADKIFAYKVRAIDKRSIADSMFRIRPLPLKDELLSSWLIRTAYMHHSDPATFLNLYFPEYDYHLWDNDLDLYNNDSFINRLSLKTGYKKEIFYGMTLKSYECRLSETIHYNNRNAFIMPIFRRKRNIRQHAQRICPLCLKEDKQPYLRKTWRLFFSTACVKHKCFLIDKCPSCGEPFVIHKRLYDGDFPHCRKCGFSFKNAEPEFISENSYGLKAIEKIYDILEKGMFEYENNYYYSFFFFYILNRFTNLIKGGYRKNLPVELGILENDELPVSNTPGIPFVMELDIKQQYILFSVLMRVFESRDGIIRFCKDNRLTVKKLTKGLQYIPFWFSEIRDIMNKTKYSMNIIETQNAMIYLTKMGIKPNLKNLETV
ncbi:MAG: TniQ family protein [bacterium]